MASKEDKPQQPARKEEKLVASPIRPTPVLKGKYLADVVNELKSPDTNKEERKRALKILESISKKEKE